MRYRTNVQEMFFFLIYVIYLSAVLGELTVFAENSAGALLLKGLRYLCYLLAVIKIIRDAYAKKQLFEMIFVFVCVACTVVFSTNNVFGFYLLMLLAAKDINVQKIIKITCYIQGGVLAVFVGLSQLGIIQDYIFDPNARVRHGLGFVWTTTAPILYFFFVMSYIYIRREKMHIVEFAILELVNYWLFVMTNARMSFALSSVLLVFIFFMRFYWQNRTNVNLKLWNALLILSPAIMCCLALYLHAGYDSSSVMWNKLNSLISGRLALGYDGIKKYGLTLFGQPIEWVGFSHGESTANYNYVDCSYLQILLENGIVLLILIVLAYVYIMYMAVKVKDKYLQTMILFIVVFSITEPRLMHLGFNPYPFFLTVFFSRGAGENLFRKQKNHFPQIRWDVLHITLKKRE